MSYYQRKPQPESLTGKLKTGATVNEGELDCIF
uniref:Uncharacterized protein n=1 Tax=Rhizophora mucronata TaxID=61149 RepID=A0A2P2P4Z0_RHIMU